MRPLTLVVLATLLAATPLTAQTLPAGFVIGGNTKSPDGHYGITVAQKAQYDSIPQTAQNQVVDLTAQKIIGPIKANLGFDDANNNEVLPARWSADNSTVLWHVDGRWCPTALAAIKLNGDTIAWQIDLLKTAQQAALTRTKKAKPSDYAAAKKQNAGSGSAFPDGFTIDVIADGKPTDPLTLPLKVQANLTANPKGIDGQNNLSAHLEGTLDANGKFTVTKFAIITQDQWQQDEDAAAPPINLNN